MIKIKSVKLNKGRTLELKCTEYVKVSSGDATSELGKKCDWLATNDMLDALKALVPHLVHLCEQDGSSDDYEITGFVIGGGDEGEGVTLIGNKKLSTGKVLNLNAPFAEFFGDEYPYAGELYEAIEKCIQEAEEYLNGKSAFKQVEIPFDEEDENTSIAVAEDKPEKKKRRVKTKEKEPVPAA